MIKDPIKNLSSSRFDLGAKLLYGRTYLSGTQQGWPFEVYKEHIRVFNNFVETDKLKIGIKQFVSVFESLISSMWDEGFNSDFAIPVSQNDIIEDGAHRLSAAILTSKAVTVKSVSKDPCNYNYQYFRDRGLQENYLDAMALEFIRWKSSLRLLIFYPSVTVPGEFEEKDFLEKEVDVFYCKEIYAKATDGKHFIQEIYREEPWVGGHKDGFKGARRKAKGCFSKDGVLRVYLIEPNQNTDLVSLKEKLRANYNLGKHSVHSTDTYDETKYLGNILFNNNTLELIRLNQVYLSKWNRVLFDELNDLIALEGIDSEHLFVHGSFLLSLLEIREARDIDLVVSTHREYQISSPNLGTHNQELKNLKFDVNDSLYNPNNFFWYKGVKVVTPNELIRYKERRNEYKDKVDVVNLRKFRKSRSYLSLIEKIRKDISSKYNKKVIKFYIKKILSDINGKN